MTNLEIQASFQRAQEVINGFKTPTVKLANDIIQLVKHISATQQTSAKPDSVDIKDFFGGIFK